MHEVVRHKRLYGNEHERMDWLPYLTYIARKPRSLRNSGIYDMMPQTMQIYMDNCESKERGRVLKVLAELTERTGFASAVRTVDEAVRLMPQIRTVCRAFTGEPMQMYRFCLRLKTKFYCHSRRSFRSEMI